ncbi:hypothetical protein OSB04_029407 [Centaurea solstitialis]|uniref:Uncharacterized protein n=1 Tax=Centaurea solstitialis TaxID=347529 RepID=A0AA38WC39_9ASTR|nr:hypothetical protein OSB04_029407 [Centaurea solstitialis]
MLVLWEAIEESTQQSKASKISLLESSTIEHDKYLPEYVLFGEAQYNIYPSPQDGNKIIYFSWPLKNLEDDYHQSPQQEAAQQFPLQLFLNLQEEGNDRVANQLSTALSGECRYRTPPLLVVLDQCGVGVNDARRRQPSDMSHYRAYR